MAGGVSSGRPGRSLSRREAPDGVLFLHGFRCYNYHGEVTMLHLI